MSEFSNASNAGGSHGLPDGVYRMRVASSGRAVDAMVVIAGNALDGGGAGYRYQGRLQLAQTTLTGRVSIRKYEDRAPAVLGLFKEITVDVSGSYDPEVRSFQFHGQLNAHHVVRIEASGRFVALLGAR
jgi:hypothetical protein